MSGTQVSSHGQLICDLLRTIARVSSSIRAKRKRSLLDEWVSHLSQVELFDSCYEMSQSENWVGVKDVLIFHSVTSTSQRGTPVLLLFNTEGKLILASDTTASNCVFGLEMNPDTYKLKYFEKELMSSLWVTLKLNKCRGGDVSIEKSTDLVALMKALSDGNCFTREPICFKGQLIVPWLQELPRFTAGQYIVALLEKELWTRWIRSRADGTMAAKCTIPKINQFSAAVKSGSAETRSVLQTRTDQNYSNVNIVQTALESFAGNDNICQKSGNSNSRPCQHEGNRFERKTTRAGMAHELVQSFLDIVRSKDHEKLVFIIGTTQKRCINGHNSLQAMNFYKKSIEAAKLWTIMYLLESQPAPFHSKTSLKTKVSPAMAETSMLSTGRVEIDTYFCSSYSLNCSKCVMRNIAEGIVSIPFLESLTPFHELKAIFCTRLLTLGANCFAKQLIDDEEDVSKNFPRKSKKKKVKKKKSFAHESYRLGSKMTGEAIVYSPAHPVCVDASTPSLLNISISPHLLTPHLMERSEACIFIGRWVDELVDSATSLSHKLSPSHYPPTISFATLTTGIKSKSKYADVVVLESKSVTAVECQLRRECEAETERLLEEEFYFPCSPINAECTREEDRRKDEYELVAASTQSLGYTDSDAIVRSAILTTSSRDSWGDMALFPMLDDYDGKKGIIGGKDEGIEAMTISAKTDSSVSSYSPSCAVEKIKKERSEEVVDGRGSLGYLRAPSDVFGGWAFDNISGEKFT